MGPNEQAYSYNAFISYRHLQPDEAVAERLQDLLERYRPPRGLDGKKRIERVFRDRTELPTSGDLDASLKDALLDSEFLIVVLSERTKESKWCMEEIRCFKQAHGGRIDRILTVLVSGEPQDTFPEELRWEERTQIGSDGSEETVRAEVEPFCCDVRADSGRKRRKKLNTEFLRIAAPLLGCGYDDLYQRHRRRERKRRGWIFGSSVSLLAAVLAVVSVFAVQTAIARRELQENLVDTYIRQGAQSETAGHLQQALMYYGRALEMDGDNAAAASGALLALQKCGWLYCDGEEEEKSGDEENASASMEKRLALRETGRLLRSEPDMPWYELYGDGETITLLDARSARTYQMPCPTALHPDLESGALEWSLQQPAVYPYLDRHAVVKYGGYLYLYEFPEEGPDRTGRLTYTLDLTTVFPEGDPLESDNVLWVSEETGMAAVENYYSVAVMDLSVPCLNAVHTDYRYFIDRVVFRPDKQGYALLFGNDLGVAQGEAGGYVEICDAVGRRKARTAQEASLMEYGCFSPDSGSLLLYGSGMLRLLDAETGEPLCVPLEHTDLRSAAFTEDGRIRIAESGGRVLSYQLREFSASGAGETVPEAGAARASGRDREYELRGGMLLSHDLQSLTLRGPDGEICCELRMPRSIDRMLVNAEESLVYLWHNGAQDLLRVPLDAAGGTLGEPVELKTRSLKCVDLLAIPNGVTAVSENNRLLLFREGSDEIEKLLELTHGGTVRSVCAGENGLLAVVFRSNEGEEGDSPNITHTFSMELWDSAMGLLLDSPAEDLAFEPKDLAFTAGGWLSYRVLDRETWLRVSPGAEADCLQHLAAGLSCYALGRTQEPEPRSPTLDAAARDGLAALFPPPEKDGGTSAPFDTAGLDAILAEQGADAWFAACDRLWEEAASGARSATLREEAAFFNYCCSNTADADLGRLRTGVAVFSGAVADDGGADAPSFVALELRLGQITEKTQELDDLVISYYERMAAFYHAASASARDADLLLQTFSFEATFRCCILAFQNAWPGMDAYRASLAGGENDALWELSRSSGTTVLPELLDGDPAQAAEDLTAYAESLRDLYEEEERMYYVSLALSDVYCLSLRCDLGAAMEPFLRALPYSTGVKLNQVSWDDLEAGFRLGDVLTGAQGRHFCNRAHALALLSGAGPERYPLVRDGERLALAADRAPSIIGTFTVWE